MSNEARALLMTCILVTVHLSGCLSDVNIEDDGVFIGRVYGNVRANGRIEGHEDYINTTVQFHFFASGEDHMIVNVSNVSRVTVVERNTTLYNYAALDVGGFSIEVHLEGVVAFPVKEFSTTYELSSFNGTPVPGDYRNDVNISNIRGSGYLDMEDDPRRFISVFDGVLVVNGESTNVSSCKVYLDESSGSRVEVQGSGVIYPYHIPWVRIDGEIELFDCVEVDSRGRDVERHDSIRFEGRELIVVTTSVPEYVTHHDGHLDPWVLRIYTGPE